MSDPVSLIASCGGVKADPHLTTMFRREVSQLLCRNNLGFPGAQPVSFSAKHLHELTKEDYYVMEKTDGIRFLMYFTRDGPTKEIHYLIDRKNEYYYVPNLHFPVPDDPTFNKFHTDTLLDGELVRDVYPNGKSELKYLVFDCLCVDNKSLMQRTLDKRLAYFKELIFRPYKEMYKKNPQEIPFRPFAIEDKSTEFSYAMEKMFREVIPRVKKLHGNDGLIFTCRGSPYKIGTDEHILKWKPPAENTVDFLLKIHWAEIDADPADADQSPIYDYDAFPRAFELLVWQGGKEDAYSHFGSLYLTPAEWEEMKALNKPLQDAVVECWFEPNRTSGNSAHTNGDRAHSHPGAEFDDEAVGGGGGGGRWRFHRLREDKAEGNHVTTVQSVIESIRDAISEQDLIQAAVKIREFWKKRQAGEAPQHRPSGPPQQQQHSSGPPSSGENGLKRKFEDEHPGPSAGTGE